MDPFENLGGVSDTQLADHIQRLSDEESEVSSQRRILHGKIDILRAELVERLRHKHGDPPAEVRHGGEGPGEAGMREPRKPLPGSAGGAIALPDPGSET